MREDLLSRIGLRRARKEATEKWLRGNSSIPGLAVRLVNDRLVDELRLRDRRPIETPIENLGHAGYDIESELLLLSDLFDDLEPVLSSPLDFEIVFIVAMAGQKSLSKAEKKRWKSLRQVLKRHYSQSK